MTSRRHFITGSLASGIGAMAASITPASAQFQKTPSSKPKESFRILHLTDVHMRPEYEAPERFVKIMRHAIKSSGKIDFILNGGDVIYAADYSNISRERMLKQWELFDNNIKPLFERYGALSSLGNHDMWWAGKKDDPMRGKDYVLERLGQKSRYMNVEKGGWVIFTLDCNNRGYLDTEQLEWLHAEYKKHEGKPMLIMSHQPLLEVAHVFGKGTSARQQEIIRPFIDSKAAPVHFLSGHTHILDALAFKNLNFHCNGALSGAWWEPHINDKNCSVDGTPMGYGIIDLYPDGHLENQYIDVTDCADGKILKS
ncbi:metallophosphoesterase family protein [Rubritalea tangerina]|uniref:Metallophosphoesterase family protein n=1 Tax=Rubritalea tangerina TaxID=430798 RepID=A0ABW4ZCQ0_9BACT